jgi:chemotaxis protein methyltransferase CheR
MELSRTAFDELRRLIHRLCGIVIADDKEYLIRHRLEPLVKKSGSSSFDEFSEKLLGLDGLPWQEAIVEAITTQETSFFRDRHPFDAIRSRVLPQLISVAMSAKASPIPRKIRCLCCGAATGQEPFSLAMLICDYLAAQRPIGVEATDFSILATDISSRALATAAAARYARRDLDRGLTPELLQRHFEQDREDWIVRGSARQIVEFRRHNLTQPLSSLGTFHLVLCRNVLIYFDLSTRQRICGGMQEILAPGGWLVLGSAESLLGIEHRFESLRAGDTLLFRKP